MTATDRGHCADGPDLPSVPGLVLGSHSFLKPSPAASWLVGEALGSFDLLPHLPAASIL